MTSGYNATLRVTKQMKRIRSYSKSNFPIIEKVEITNVRFILFISIHNKVWNKLKIAIYHT